jgi:hypothetical protein
MKRILSIQRGETGVPVTRDEVIWGFRCLLGREPESEETIAAHCGVRNLEALRGFLLSSAEFREKSAQAIDFADNTAPDLNRQVVVFIHVPKCAGTSLHLALLKRNFKSVCPERHNGLGNWSAAALARYNLFSGHFDITTLDLIPAKRMSIVTLLRRPKARLISAYRFLRAHTPQAMHLQNHNMNLVHLARENDPVSFFCHPELVHHSTINNGMVRMLSGPVPQKRWEAYYPGRVNPPTITDEAPDKALKIALTNLGRMAAFGVVEHMDQSVGYIFETLGLNVPAQIEKHQVLDVVTQQNPLLEAVPPVELTPALSAALAPHITLDKQLYDRALAILSGRGVKLG